MNDEELKYYIDCRILNALVIFSIILLIIFKFVYDFSYFYLLVGVLSLQICKKNESDYENEHEIY